MAETQPIPATYKFNEFSDVKSHSSILFNNNLAFFFFQLNHVGMKMNSTDPSQGAIVPLLYQFKGLLKQIYKNVLPLLYFNPTCRSTMNLNTKDPGIYVTDVVFALVEQKFRECQMRVGPNQNQGAFYVPDVLFLIDMLNDLESLLRKVLQYYGYFIRADFRQSPDVDRATQQYKALIDPKTVEQLRSIVGKNHKVNFDALGTTRVSPPDIGDAGDFDIDDDDEPLGEEEPQ